MGHATQGALPEKAGVWLDVPFVKQAENGCGSASISMLLQYWSGRGTVLAPMQADAGAIQEKLYSRKARGILSSDMERYLRESGFRVFAFSGAWSDLQQHLEKGRPLIIGMQPGRAKTVLHYVVVAGIDWQHDAVFVNDPVRGKLIRIKRTEFEKQWEAASNWMLLAVPE